MVGRLSVLTMPSSRWPRAAARGSVAPDICAKSALPEITALAEPMPVITTLLTFSPCRANRPEVFREITRREVSATLGTASTTFSAPPPGWA
jgi:hypothetical protein